MEAAASAKLKEQLTNKDRKITELGKEKKALTAQLKLAGCERCRSESPKAKKGDGKGKTGKDKSKRSGSPESGKDMTHVVRCNCGKRSRKKERGSDSESSSSGGSGSDKPKSERLCHFHKPWPKPPKKCEKGDKCKYMHGKEKPKKRGTPGITHTTQNALFGGVFLSLLYLEMFFLHNLSTSLNLQSYPHFALTKGRALTR